MLHTAVCNHGNHGITLEPILEVIVSKMGSEPCCVGMFMDWLNVLSPELDCFKVCTISREPEVVYINRSSEL